MKRGQLRLLALLAVVLYDSRTGLAAGTAVDPAAAEAAVRQADADWAAAAGTGGVEAWMVFYTADAIVLLPKGPLASGKELARQSVTRLLAQPNLAVAWHPIKVEMARSGDLAFVSSSYDLRFSDARGTPLLDRGRRIEIWRKQADGPWRCIVDTWNSDEPAATPSALPAAPAAAAPTSAQGAPPTAGTAAPSGPTEPPPPAPTVATKYGDVPGDYKEAIRRYFQDHLKNPESIQYRQITQPEQGYVTSIGGSFLMREQRVYGWKVKATINATNSHDKYVGFKTYTFLFRGEKLVNALSPLPEDEMN